MFTPTSVQSASAVPGQVDPAIVGADPDEAGLSPGTRPG